MATRPVFVPSSEGSSLVKEVDVEFEWHPGFSDKQKRKCVRSLHESAQQHGLTDILEISTKSESDLGQRLSAFNLMLRKDPPISVESAYQGSKVFEDGGPYTDLYEKDSWEAKKDDRIRNSGELIAFDLKGMRWPLQPKTAFYDWLYLRALNQYNGLIDKLVDYDGFTDIEFNPDKSVNCQARAVAMGVALRSAGKLKMALDTQESFINTVENGVEGIERKKVPANYSGSTKSIFSQTENEKNCNIKSETDSRSVGDKKEKIDIDDKKDAIRKIAGETIKYLREKKNLTQEELGNRLNISRSSVSDIERANRNITIGSIMEYLDELDAELEIKIKLESTSINIDYIDRAKRNSKEGFEK